jgi:23S rRNA (guanosine2251-2'-O)-methyltransferase
LGGEQVEGRRAVAALLAAGRRRVLDVWTLQPGGDHQPPAVVAIEEAARTRRVPVRRVSRERLAAEARTSAPQGVLAHAEPLPEADLDDLLRPSATEPPFLLALDGVTDPQNLGALLRSAAAAGAGGAVLGRHRAAHVTPSAAKAAAGAVETLPLAVVAGIPAALGRARERGCWTVGLAPDGDASLFDLELATEPVVLVVGAEGEGIGSLTRRRCDAVVRIPMAEGSQSLNVAAAGTLALFEVRRRRQRGH